jgi:hypothetical protein
MQDMNIEELEQMYNNKVISVIVTYRDKPVKGRLVKTRSDFIVLERFSGDRSSIRLSSILGINEGCDKNDMPVV